MPLLFSVLPSISMAMPDDNTQIIHLKAGFVDIDQSTHLGHYKDNIELDQGTTHLRASKATTVSTTSNQLIKAVIEGNRTIQAHYWTQTETNKPLLHAYADKMYYYPERHLIELIGHARVEQGDDTLSAPHIQYDTLHQHVLTQPEGKAQTFIVIHPKKQEKQQP